MTRMLRSCVSLGCAGLLGILTAAAQSAPAAAPGAAPPGAQGPPGGRNAAPPQNLKVLPKDTSIADVRKLMRQFTGDLGVECEFCHAQNADTKRTEFPSDANPVKDTARFMIGMTSDLNNKYLDVLPNRRYADPITCGTCHQGHSHPAVFVPPPRPQGNGPGGPPPPSAVAPPPK
jgi:hypothetical protein